MIFLSLESKPLSRRRRSAMAAVMVIGATFLGPAQPSIDGAEDWDYGATPRDLPTLDWTATPPAPEKRLQRQALDMAYPEVAAVLEKRMSRQESPEKIRATAAQIVRLCHLLGFQPSFILAVIQHESSFKAKAVSKAGAVGLMQLLPATARTVGKNLGIYIPRGGGRNLRDPVINVTLGMHYLAQLQDDFKTLASTLAAYNLGPAQWTRFLSRPEGNRPRTVAKYVALIQRTTAKMKELGRTTAWSSRIAASR